MGKHLEKLGRQSLDKMNPFAYNRNMEMEGEVWKSIPGYTGYEASSKGRVRSFKQRKGKQWTIADQPQRILSLCKSRKYLYVRIPADSGGWKSKRVHSLVLLAFAGTRPRGMEVCHYDGNPENNSLENLRYDTVLGNMADDIRNSVTRGPRSILTEKQVIKMRTEYRNGKSLSVLAERFGVGKEYVRAICRGRALKSCGGPITQRTRVGQHGKQQGKQRKQSRFRGVSWDKKCKKWRAQIWIGGRGGAPRHLGHFSNEVRAARAYNTAAREKYKDDEVALAIVLNKIEL